MTLEQAAALPFAEPLPLTALHWFARGLAQHELGKLAAAIADYDQVIALNPQYADAYNNRGLAHRLLADMHSAAADYRQVLKLQPDQPLSWIGLADALRHLGDEAGWRDAIEQARAHAAGLSLYDAACLESVAANVDQALDLLAQAVAAGIFDAAWAKQDPDLAWVRDDPRFAEIVEGADSRF